MDKSKSAVSIYNRIVKQYASSFKASEFEIEIISKFIDSLSGGNSILDAGCWNCDYGYLFKKMNIKYTWIDLSEEMISLAANTYPDFDFSVQDMRNIDLKDNQFSWILSSFSLIHIPDWEIDLVLKKFNTLLKSNWKLLIALQEWEGEAYEDEPFLPWEKMYLNLFSRDKIKQKLKECWFNIIQTWSRPPKSKNEFQYNKLYILAEKKENNLT